MIQAYGLKTHIWNNNLRSVLLLIFFPILLMLVVFALTLIWANLASNAPADQVMSYAAGRMPSVAPWAIGAAGSWFVVAFFGHQKIAPGSNGPIGVGHRQFSLHLLNQKQSQALALKHFLY